MATVTFPPTQSYQNIRKWDLSTIWKLTEGFQVKQIEVNKLWDERYSKVFCWTHDGEEVNNLFFLHHMKRVLKADLNYPIILSEEEYIFDGVHRLMKAKHLGMKYIPCVQFDKDPPTSP